MAQVKNIIQNTFFDGELSSLMGDDEEMQDDANMNQSHMPFNNEQLRVPSLNHINSSLLNTITQNNENRDRLMSESVDLNYNNRSQTFSLFDLLINNKRNNQNMQNNLSSSLIENLLTDYLISLPSSLEEFYKIMGEIYVAEIMRQ